MDYVLYKLILGNKDKTDLQFIVQLLELSEKVFKTALSKKHKISHRLILRQWPRYLPDHFICIFLSFAAPQ